MSVTGNKNDNLNFFSCEKKTNNELTENSSIRLICSQTQFYIQFCMYE